MSEKLLNIFEQSGDANIGQTLLRLARMAEAAHRFEIVRQSQEQFREGKRRVEGLNPRVAATPLDTEVPAARSSHTEVVR